MIALIALFALAVIVGMVIGIIAIVVALIKAIIRRLRRRRTNAALSAADGVSGDLQTSTNREFLRLIASEWPETDRSQ